MEPKSRKKSKPKPKDNINLDVAPEVEPSVSAVTYIETSVPPTMTEATMSETQTSTETTTSAETQPNTNAGRLYAWEVPDLSPNEKLQYLIAGKAENATTITEVTQKLARAEEEVAGLKQSLTLLRTVGSAIDAGLLEFNIGTAPRHSGPRGPRVPAPTKDAILSYFEATGVARDTIDGLAFHFGCSESTLRGVLTGMVSYGDLVTATASELRAKGVTLDAAVKARTVFYFRA
tara:strand:+ start:664 stop:1362 length:699 start_codon:yes stop_codon:yes gene_type:complete